MPSGTAAPAAPSQGAGGRVAATVARPRTPTSATGSGSIIPAVTRPGVAHHLARRTARRVNRRIINDVKRSGCANCGAPPHGISAEGVLAWSGARLRHATALTKAAEIERLALEGHTEQAIAKQPGIG